MLFLPPSERTKRKPLTRPALPVLTSPKERLLDWSADVYKSDWMNSGDSCKYGLRIDEAAPRRADITDSGIEVLPATRHQGGESVESSLSDGYSSDIDGEDTVTTLTTRRAPSLHQC